MGSPPALLHQFNEQYMWAKMPLASILLAVSRAHGVNGPYDVLPNKPASWRFKKGNFGADF